MTTLHPDYGLADETRVAIMLDAETMGVKEAARLHNVHQSTIYKWRKVYAPEDLTAMCFAIAHDLPLDWHKKDPDPRPFIERHERLHERNKP
jgi:hypothetical protein